jgi:DNA helicase-2/ATP-dependent DNA helicase PcrA
LFISYCRSRRIWGNIQPAAKSRFVAELDKNYTQSEKFLQEEGKLFDNSTKNDIFAKSFVQKSEPVKQIISKPKNLTKITPTPKSTEQTKEFDTRTGLAVGMTVEHDKFGIGVVLKIEGDFPDSKALVNFKNAGQKNLLLKYAKLNIIKN